MLKIIKTFATWLINSISNFTHDYQIIRKNKDILWLRAYVTVRNGVIRHENWGDDLNEYFISSLTKRKILFKNKSFFGIFVKQNYVCIGSVLDWISDKHSIIWGSGIMFNDRPLKVTPKQVLAVRGHLTREYLLKYGIECPEIYGDPALLLPYFYRPQQTKKYHIGFIPHICHQNDPVVKDFLRNNTNTVMIDLHHYRDWHDVIDLINQCELIISSSLHGLIVSDAYSVPNVWVKLSFKLSGGDFKFQDYFSSVGRKSEPIVINKAIDMQDIESKAKEWKAITWDPKPLLEACPFKNADYSEIINITNL